MDAGIQGRLEGEAALSLPRQTLSVSQLVEHFLVQQDENSRTFRGISDTSSSAEKLPLELTGAELANKTRANVEEQLRKFLGLATLQFPGPRDTLVWMVYLSQKLNDGLLGEDRPILRTWTTPYPQQPEPGELEVEFAAFAKEFFERWSNPNFDAVSLAAWIEHEFNGRLHPLYDGCGRTSRTMAAIFLGRSGVPYPRFASREEFFSKINEPFDLWLQYYRSGVSEAQAMLYSRELDK